MEHIPVLAKKQSLSEAVERNASDYFRMFDVKCSYWSKQMTPQCVAMVCLDLAARTAGVPFDKVISSCSSAFYCLNESQSQCIQEALICI